MVLFSSSFLLWYGKLLRLASENGRITFSVMHYYALSFGVCLVDFVMLLKLVNETGQ